MHSDIPLASFWFGDRLTYIERLCLASAVDVGHRVILYSYSNLTDVPSGVELRDASIVMQKSQYISCSDGVYPLGANIFRYKMLSTHTCIWIDTDVLFVAPISMDTDYIFGWEDKEFINNAVLRLPSDSAILREMQDFISQQTIIAPWWSARQKWQQQRAISAGSPIKLSHFPWGTFGPKLLTYVVKKNRLEHLAQETRVFYPIHHRHYRKPFERGSLDSFICRNTATIHLWNNKLGPLKDSPPSPGSFVESMMKHLKIYFP